MSDASALTLKNRALVLLDWRLFISIKYVKILSLSVSGTGHQTESNVFQAIFIKTVNNKQLFTYCAALLAGKSQA